MKLSQLTFYTYKNTPKVRFRHFPKKEKKGEEKWPIRDEEPSFLSLLSKDNHRMRMWGKNGLMAQKLQKQQRPGYR